MKSNTRRTLKMQVYSKGYDRQSQATKMESLHQKEK